MPYRKINHDWNGQTAVIFASGSSVALEDIEIIQRARYAGRCKVIAINAMYQEVDFADVLYFCDFQFYAWHTLENPDPAFINYPAPKYTLCNKTKFLPPDINLLKQGEEYGLSREKDTLNTGRNSGYQCLNLCYHLGVSRIILIGYDMQPNSKGRTHYHKPHKRETPLTLYDDILKGGFFESIATELYKERIEVINTNINSAVHCFTKIPLREIIL